MRNVVAVSFPKHVWTLLAVYFVASLAHFAHNAEFIAYYPNMPAWLTRDDIYLAWSAVTSAGVAGLVLYRFGLYVLSVPSSARTVPLDWMVWLTTLLLYVQSTHLQAMPRFGLK